MTRILVVSAGTSNPSSSRLLADRLAEATRGELGDNVTLETVELRQHAHEIADNLLTGFPGGQLRSVLEQVEAADGLILVTPTFSASYSGLFKSFMDVIDPDSVRGKPVLIGATGGTERHSLVLDYALRPLLAYFRAIVLPTGVYAASSDWGGSSEFTDRIARAAGELAEAVASQSAKIHPDAFDRPVPFEELLRGASAR